MERGDPHTLLVGIQAGVAAVGNSMELTQKVKNRATLQPSNCTASYLPKKDKTQIQRDTRASRFRAELLTAAELRN